MEANLIFQNTCLQEDILRIICWFSFSGLLSLSIDSVDFYSCLFCCFISHLFILFSIFSWLLIGAIINSILSNSRSIFLLLRAWCIFDLFDLAKELINLTLNDLAVLKQVDVHLDRLGGIHGVFRDKIVRLRRYLDNLTDHSHWVVLKGVIGNFLANLGDRKESAGFDLRDHSF